MPIITNQNIWAVPLLIVWLLLIVKGGRRGRIAAVVLLVAVGLTDIIAAQVIKPLVGRLRPSHSMPDLINLLVRRGGKYGFVSNHAANMFAAATVLGYFYERWRKGLFMLAAVVAFSRVYVGVHYPGDVLAGAAFGYLVAWIILTGWVLIKMRELKRGRTWVWYAGPAGDLPVN
ncbi:MAG: phosphatase PAP2 family protein [Candidatus Neomarinimicrobiota bacterium]